MGLTTLLISYLRRGDTEQTSYAKNIAPIMARTDFATLFKSLPKEERAYLEGDGGKVFAEYVLFAARLENTGDTPVFKLGLSYYGQLTPKILDSLTREKWLTGIANGVDYMTKANIGNGAEREMESLGALGSKTDKVAGGGTAPVFELRRMRQAIPSEEWSDLALRVFDLIVATNKGRGMTKPTY